MPLRDPLLAEFDHEMQTTRTVLAAVPAQHAAFRPHSKSWTMGELALHVANLPNWLSMTLSTTELDLDPPDGNKPASPRYESPAATLQFFDANVAAARSALAIAADRDLHVAWTLKNRGETVLTMPRLQCVRSFVLNHLIHHRGQLTVYLRLCDVPVPEVYGPTADSRRR